MNKEEAKNRLFTHGSFLPNSQDWPNCFLGMLKPYRRTLSDDIYYDILDCLKTLFDEITTEENIDARIVAAVHGILHSGRMWLSNPESALRKSGRICDDEVARLESWLNNISAIYHAMLMVKTDKEHLFSQYVLETSSQDSALGAGL